MSEVTVYVIIGVVAYTMILCTGYIVAARRYKKTQNYVRSVENVVKELELLLDYKEEKEEMKNNLSLSNLLNNKPTEENYKEIIEDLKKVAQDTYKDFKFFIARSSDETKQPNFLQIVSNFHECPELHRKIFAKAIENGIDMKVLQAKFAEEVANGNVIPLGEDVTVIIHDGTPQLATGVSPINSGLEGGEITFIISFINKENYEEWAKNNLEDGNENA